MRSVSPVVLGSLVIIACSGEPTTPPLLPPVLAVKAPNNEVPPLVAVDDALQRLLPTLDAATARSLSGPLTTISVVLNSKTKDYAALKGAIAAANAALAIALARNDESAPDLGAIALVISTIPTK